MTAALAGWRPWAGSARLALALLTAINVVSFMDRLLFAILQEGIKRDLALSDFQLGLIAGPAFAILYAVAAIPIARLADRSSRVRIVTVVLAAWSAMTALS